MGYAEQEAEGPKMLAEIARLKAEVERLKGLVPQNADLMIKNHDLLVALEWYADNRNWRSITDGCYQYIVIDKSDEVSAKNQSFPTIKTAGKRAREALGRNDK
jgi:hypothetical protein